MLNEASHTDVTSLFLENMYRVKEKIKDRGDSMIREILRMDNITKVYDNGVIANKEVNFSISEQEIHALMGENGAGKSTLMKILFGAEKFNDGAIYIKGEKVDITSPTAAIKLGIGMVHQHFMLVPSLTVAENLVLGMEPKKRGFFNYEEAVKITKKLSDKYNFSINPNDKVEDLPVGIKQKVEILKALARGAKILILDEPTAVLTPQETKELFGELIALKNNGHTIIFISHKLKEIKSICDRITIMRNGRSVGVHNVEDVSEEDISRLMVGRDVVLKVDKKKCSPKENILNVKNLNYINEIGKKVVKDISFNVRSGEILGIAGVEGNGQRELVEVITGLKRATAGEITINGTSIKGLSIKDIRELRTSHVPEDRMTYGAAADASIEENLISDRIDSKKLNKGILLNNKFIKDLATKLIKDYKIKCDNGDQGVGMLSGGNIQKVVVAREFSSSPKLLIVNQPTRGIDVGAIEFIRKKLVELRDEGVAILLISADLNEVMELSDSLLVMYSGEISAYIKDPSAISEHELGSYMLGFKKQKEDEIKGCIYE